MPILTNQQLTEARNSCEKYISSVNYDKTQINAALQAIEDTFEASRAAFSSAINAATAPLVLSNAQKKSLVKAYLLTKFNIE